MTTQDSNQDTEHSANIIDNADKLVPAALPPLPADEAAVLDTFIRHKRVEARAKARAQELASTVLAILRVRKAVERRGAFVRLNRRYDYLYSPAVDDIQETLRLACARERKEGLAKAEPKLSVAFEDVSAKSLKAKVNPVAKS